MKKINKQGKQFPNIFRFIPESKFIKDIVKSEKVLTAVFVSSIFISSAFLIVILYVGILLFNNVDNLFDINSTKRSISTEAKFWNSISNKYDGYKDAYFQLAVDEYKLGNFNYSKKANERVLLLDPNFIEAKKLEELLKDK